MSDEPVERLSAEELAAESGTALPAKEVMSLLDLNANLDLALDTAAPIDLAVGANANIAAPINAAVDANVLSVGSDSQAGALQTGTVHQGIIGDATATSDQHSSIDQGNPTTTTPGTAADPTGTSTGGGTGAAVPDPTGATSGATTGSVTDGNLLNVNVDLNGDLHLASPIDGAVAANANAAAPINASAAANIGTIDSHATALGEQNVEINQTIDGNATATGNQDSAIAQQSGTQDAGGAAAGTADAGGAAAGTADAGGAPGSQQSGTP
ncbi:MAG TPA: hypothetical protein VGH43_09135 [Jatrophihabitans sp.]